MTKMVEARTNKLSEWSVSLHKYEEVYVGTVRSYDDLAHEVSKLEESVLEGMSDERLYFITRNVFLQLKMSLRIVQR